MSGISLILAAITSDKVNLLEDKRVVSPGKSSADACVHSVDISLINGHTFLGQTRRVINRHIVQIGMMFPVIVQDQ